MATSRSKRWSAGLLGVGALLLGTAAAAAAGVEGIGVGAEAMRSALRTHELRMLDGASTTLGALRGQVVVVSFWASWCPPCRRELPMLAALQTDLARKGARVVAVSIDQDVRNARGFAAKRAPGLTVAHDGPEGLARALDLRHVPLTLVIDKSGEVAFASRASDARSIQKVGEVARRLASSPPSPQALDAGNP